MKVGKVVHYYDKIGVAILELKGSLKVGDRIKFLGHGADFEQEVDSLQVDHEQVKSAKKGEMVGLKAEKEVKEGTEVEKV
jgi:translation elongation factor EF-1alpha